MGGMLHFRELHGIRDSEPTRGVRILDIGGLREHVDENLSETLAFDTVDGNEYPRYEYLHGLYYQHHDKPISEPYFIDNVYPDTYDDLFAGLSEYTEPFVVLAAQSFPRLDELLEGTTRTPYLVYAANGEATQQAIELSNIPDLISEMKELAEGENKSVNTDTDRNGDDRS